MIPHLHPHVQTRKGEIECVAFDDSPFHSGRDSRRYADVVGEHAASLEGDREACDQNQDARRSHTGALLGPESSRLFGKSAMSLTSVGNIKAILGHCRVWPGPALPVGKEPWGTRLLGKAASREFITDLFMRIPDVHYEELRHFVCPEHVVVELVRTGTPRGGTRSEDHLVDILTIRDGKIAAMRAYGKTML